MSALLSGHVAGLSPPYELERQHSRYWDGVRTVQVRRHWRDREHAHRRGSRTIMQRPSPWAHIRCRKWNESQGPAPTACATIRE